MLGTRTTWSRATVLPAVVTAGIVCWMVGDLTVSKTHAQQAQSTFMGGTPSRLDLNGLSTSRLKFPAGSRSNWHSHATGQLLMAEEGRGRTQERGKPIREVVPGQPWWTPAGVEHWHGAAPDQDLVQLTIYAGEVKWLEPVTDAVYRAAVGK